MAVSGSCEGGDGEAEERDGGAVGGGLGGGGEGEGGGVDAGDAEVRLVGVQQVGEERVVQAVKVVGEAESVAETEEDGQGDGGVDVDCGSCGGKRGGVEGTGELVLAPAEGEGGDLCREVGSHGYAAVLQEGVGAVLGQGAPQEGCERRTKGMFVPDQEGTMEVFPRADWSAVLVGFQAGEPSGRGGLDFVGVESEGNGVAVGLAAQGVVQGHDVVHCDVEGDVGKQALNVVGDDGGADGDGAPGEGFNGAGGGVDGLAVRGVVPGGVLCACSLARARFCGWLA